MRERIAIIFMTISVIATLIMGGAVLHELNRPTVYAGSPVAQVSPTSGTVITNTPGATTSPGAGGTTTTTTTNNGGGSGHTSDQVVAKGGTITVGGIFDETGAVDATVERDTVRSYFAKVNDAGGVNGYKFQMIDCDSKYSGTEAHICAQRLISQKVMAIVGWLSVNGEENEVQYLNDQGVPVVGGLGVPHEFQEPLSWPVAANFVNYGTAMGNHAKDLGIHAPAIVLLDVNFIAPTEAALVASLHKNGITEKSIDHMSSTAQLPDYQNLVAKIQLEGADSIIAGLDPFSYGRFFQALDRQNFHPKFFGLGLDKHSANLEYKSSVYGAEGLTPFLEPDGHESNAAMSDYLATVKKYFPNQVAPLDVYTVGSWVAAELFVEAVRRLGDRPVSATSIVESLNSIKNWDTGGLSVPISFSPGNTHDPNRCFEWIRNKPQEPDASNDPDNYHGKWETYSDWQCV